MRVVSCIRFTLILILLIQSSCVTLYKPNAINSPLLKNKGELKGTLGISEFGSGLLNVEAAYAFTDHMGGILNGMYHTKFPSTDTFFNGRHNQFFGETGAGYFTTFGEKKNGVFQCYGGGGTGYTNDYFSQIDENHARSTAHYNNFFFQPGIAFSNGMVDVAFDLRTKYVNIYNIQSTSDFYNDTAFNFINLEPTVTIRAGGKKIKGFVQGGITYAPWHSDAYFNANNPDLFIIGSVVKFSLGINLTFNTSKVE